MNKHVKDTLLKQGIPNQVERMIVDEQEIQHLVELEQAGALPKNIKKQPQVIKDLNTIQQLSENYLNHQTLPENIERVETKDQYGNQRFLYIKKNTFDYFILETLDQNDIELLLKVQENTYMKRISFVLLYFMWLSIISLSISLLWFIYVISN